MKKTPKCCGRRHGRGKPGRGDRGLGGTKGQDVSAKKESWIEASPGQGGCQEGHRLPHPAKVNGGCEEKWLEKRVPCDHKLYRQGHLIILEQSLRANCRGSPFRTPWVCRYIPFSDILETGIHSGQVSRRLFQSSASGTEGRK